MGFGLVVCWVRRALNCCVACWRRCVELNGNYTVTPSSLFAFWCLFHATTAMLPASSFLSVSEGTWWACSTFLMQWNIFPHVPRALDYLTEEAFGQTQDILLINWGSSVKKRRGSQTSVHSVVTWAACCLPNAYLVSPEHWKRALLSSESCSFMFWLFLSPPRLHGPSPMQPSVNLCKVGSCVVL